MNSKPQTEPSRTPPAGRENETTDKPEYTEGEAARYVPGAAYDMAQAEIRSLRAERDWLRVWRDRLLAKCDEVQAESVALRRLLWLHHGHTGAALYGDDGEMQCVACGMDFKRDSIAAIQRRFLALDLGREVELTEPLPTPLNEGKEKP